MKSIIICSIMLLAFGTGAQAKARLDVDSFNAIIEENAKLQVELTEKVREQAGIQRPNKKTFGTIQKENRTIEIPTENIASETNSEFLKQKELSPRRQSPVNEINKVSAEIREAGRTE